MCNSNYNDGNNGNNFYNNIDNNDNSNNNHNSNNNNRNENNKNNDNNNSNYSASSSATGQTHLFNSFLVMNLSFKNRSLIHNVLLKMHCFLNKSLLLKIGWASFIFVV